VTTPLVPHPVLVRETVDRHGDVIDTEQIILDAMIAAPRATAEPLTDRAMVVTTRTLYGTLPVGVVVLASDKFELPGESGRWRVVGDAFDWTHPFSGWAPGVEIALERVDG
jgi:hypothetical protein